MSDNEIVATLFVALCKIFLIPFFFMLIWNAIMPQVCNFQELTYWQSFFIGIGLRLINGTISIKSTLNEINNR